MREHERLLTRLTDVLKEIARPYSCDAAIPVAVQAQLWRLGVACEATTPREDLIAVLWARRRTLETTPIPFAGGPGATPPPAA